MTREQLEHAISAAGAIRGDRELYIVGSQSILGPCPDPHPDLCRSTEVDIAPKNRPDLEALIEGSIGELSPFHNTFGSCVDGVNIEGIVLPDGWRQRTVSVDNPNTNGIWGLSLDPGDLAVSKLAAGRPKDLDYVAVLLREKVVTSETVRERIEAVSRLGESDKDRLRQRLARLADTNR